MNAYLVIVTWPNGIEGLLFPRPGNVAIATTMKEGYRGFEIARKHLEDYQQANPTTTPVKIRLQRFEFKEIISEVTL